MLCFRGSGRQRHHRSAVNGIFSKAVTASKAGCMRLSKPFTRVVKPLTACFVGSRSKTEPTVQARNQASKSPKPQPAAAETILMPAYRGPVTNNSTSSTQPMQDITCVDCLDGNGIQANDNNWVLGTLTSEVAGAPQPGPSNSLETAPAAAQLLHSPSLAAPHTCPMSADMSSPVRPDSATLSANMPDSPDHQALLAEILVRVYERVSQDGQCQPADQTVNCSEQTEKPQGVDGNLTTSAAAQLDIMADTSEPPVDMYEINSGCSKSADDVAGSVLTAMVDVIVSSEVQHAAVDQVVDDLLTEVSAAFAPEHDSLPADITAAKEAASLAAVPAADSQEESAIPASNTLSAQSSRQLAAFLPQARLLQTTMQPVATAAKPALEQLQPVLPASSSNGKENVPAAEARQSSPSKAREAAGIGSVGKGRQWWHHKSAFEMMAQSLPIGPSSQASLMESKLAELGGGPAHQTILALPPTPTSAPPLVLRVCTVDSEWESSGCSSVAKEALLMYTCAHPNVVPITILGLGTPPSPLTSQDPRHVAYFGMPLADISLERRLGQEAWGKNGRVKLAYQGPSLLTLVKYAQAILKALAHTHSCRVLHRGLTPDHVLLFSRAGQEAEGEVRRATKPAAIKHSVRLAGFGAAAKLNERGVALHPSPYRCAEGYVPPEARQNSPLTTAADVYQMGGLCYFMALGCHPPAGDPAPLPDYVPQEWRLVVSQCRTINPIDRPTLAHLQLHLLSLCCHIKQSPKSMKASIRSPAVKPTQAAAHSQGLLPSVASQNMLRTPSTTAVAASESDVVLPSMAVNPLYLPSTSPPHTPPADHTAASPARTHHAPVTAAASQAAMAAIRSQKALASAALGFGSARSMPKLMWGADQWLPEETTTLVGHSQGSIPHSHTAAGKRQQSVADPDADTAAAGIERAAMHVFMPVEDSRVAAPSTNSLEAAPATMDLGFRHSGNGSQAGCAEQQRLCGLTSEASEILQAVVSSHQAPAGPFGSFCDALDYAIPSSSTAALGQQAGEFFTTSLNGSLKRADISQSLCRTPSSTALIMSEEDGEDDSRHVQAADMGHFVSPSKYPVSQRLVGSPRLRLLPRRDDSALEKPSVTGWMAQAQGKAAGFAASVGHRASEVAEQTSALLQHWSEGQQATTTMPVSTAVTARRHLLPHRSGRGSSAGLGSIVAHSFGVDEMCPQC